MLVYRLILKFNDNNIMNVIIINMASSSTTYKFRGKEPY